MSLSDFSSSPQPANNLNQSELCSHFITLVESIGEHFSAVTAHQHNRITLFVTQTPPLFQVFLEALPPALRQTHTCSACRRFVERYGGIVSIASDGKLIPVMWNSAIVPAPYTAAIAALSSVVSRSPIDNVFLSDQSIWGIPQTSTWQHLAVVPSDDLIFKPSLVKTIAQVVAEKKQDYEMLLRGLEEFPLKVVKKAHALLTTETLYRSEKCIDVARWLVRLHEQRQASRNLRATENLTWLAVANAPPGFCHVRSSMIGTLLEDIQADLPFAQIKLRFDAKMHPLQYLRPTAAPTDGNIAQAEKIVETLKTAGSLERRFAKLDDLQAVWLPASSKTTAQKNGIFSHLRQSASSTTAPFEVPPITMTWDKFSKTVLPTAATIEYFVPASNQSYMALITAQNPDAPPIVQWDFEDNRNPVTWYFYVDNSPPAQWNLSSGVYHPVTAIVLQPSIWNAAKNFAHHGEKVFFILKDAKDKGYRQGCGFFPQFLKNEYHGVRSTIEAYAKTAVVHGKDEAEGCGLGLQKGNTWNQVFRVTSKDQMQVVYKLDRWD
ncbi:hypothetical protein [Phormidesmis sp. 146-33]